MSIEARKTKMKQIEVGIYGNDDAPFSQRILQIEAFLLQHGGSCEVTKQIIATKEGEQLQVVFSATIPQWFTDQHHAFDSKLNSTQSGFGVAWVSER